MTYEELIRYPVAGNFQHDRPFFAAAALFIMDGSNPMEQRAEVTRMYDQAMGEPTPEDGDEAVVAGFMASQEEAAQEGPATNGQSSGHGQFESMNPDERMLFEAVAAFLLEDVAETNIIVMALEPYAVPEKATLLNIVGFEKAVLKGAKGWGKTEAEKAAQAWRYVDIPQYADPKQKKKMKNPWEMFMDWLWVALRQAGTDPRPHDGFGGEDDRYGRWIHQDDIKRDVIIRMNSLGVREDEISYKINKILSETPALPWFKINHAGGRWFVGAQIEEMGYGEEGHGELGRIKAQKIYGLDIKQLAQKYNDEVDRIAIEAAEAGVEAEASEVDTAVSEFLAVHLDLPAPIDIEKLSAPDLKRVTDSASALTYGDIADIIQRVLETSRGAAEGA